MTDTLSRRGPGSSAPPPGVVVRELRNPREIEGWLSSDRAYSAYALGHLEPELFDGSHYWVAEGSAGEGLVMHARALGPVTVTLGEGRAVAAILSLHPGARASYLSTGSEAHVPYIRATHDVINMLPMMRMSVTAATFAEPDGSVRRLRGYDATRISALYAIEGAPSQYAPDTIERAVYYGVVEGDRLVAVAGTHIVSPHQSIAVVGNVFTHPSYRGRGYATRTTGAVTRELLERGCAEVVLTVDPANAPAVAAYGRLGYRRETPVIEARLRRHDTLGIQPALRRYTARRRGRALGGVELLPPGKDL